MNKKTFRVRLTSNKTYPEMKMSLAWDVPIERLGDFIGALERFVKIPHRTSIKKL